MIKKVKVSALSPDMYIQDVNCNWMDHPFLRNSFKLESQRDIDKLREYGISEVYIDTEQGLDVDDAPNCSDVQLAIEKKLQSLAEHAIGATTRQVPLEAELRQAKIIYREANQLVRTTLLDCRLGKQVELEKLEHTVADITASIFRNPDAIISLLRIKQADQYTFQHSVAVGTLLISFCRALQINAGDTEQAGIGGLLHDIGKMRVPNHILNKPGTLNEEEFAQMKEHVSFGCEYMANMPGISTIASNIAAEHHERFNGSGYPRGTKGEHISQYGQMSAIVDVYDALTSNRVYHVGKQPTEVLKKLLEWSEAHFCAQLVHQFIRIIGIYPVGSLVKLESGQLAIVIEQHHEDLLHPTVRTVFNSHSHQYISPKDYDLSKPGASDRIVSFEIPANWHIDTMRHIAI